MVRAFSKHTMQKNVGWLLRTAIKPKVAVIREEKSNGDGEMAAAFQAAGFEPWDVTMSDLLNGRISLQEFHGIAFVADLAMLMCLIL
ncbi:phosphoribosylformylglycinamidine synthase [Spatholobus suberectus]|nr:phosphoribosylformylglycinamidine synthase [Spatholobus suberectus]